MCAWARIKSATSQRAHTNVLDHVGGLLPFFHGSVSLLLVKRIPEERRVLGHALNRLKRKGARGESRKLPRRAGEQEPGCSPRHLQIRRLPGFTG